MDQMHVCLCYMDVLQCEHPLYCRDGQEYFVQILRELHLGPLVQVNLEQMRARAHDNIRKMKVKEDNKPVW